VKCRTRQSPCRQTVRGLKNPVLQRQITAFFNWEAAPAALSIRESNRSPAPSPLDEGSPDVRNRIVDDV